MSRPAVARLAVGCAVLAALTTAGGCGRKTAPKPPQLVAPRPVTAVALSAQPTGVEVSWDRSTDYVDGSRMTDLGGFLVERQEFGPEFREIARVEVTDRGRFRQQKRFEYLDEDMMPGTTYHYRVVAFTLDGYYSASSGVATITWSPPETAPPPSTPSE